MSKMNIPSFGRSKTLDNPNPAANTGYRPFKTMTEDPTEANVGTYQEGPVEKFQDKNRGGLSGIRYTPPAGQSKLAK